MMLCTIGTGFPDDVIGPTVHRSLKLCLLCNCIRSLANGKIVGHEISIAQ